MGDFFIVYSIFSYAFLRKQKSEGLKMDLFWQQFDKISAFLWDPFLLLALGGAGVFCTLRFNFVQLRGFFPACRQVFHGAFSQKAS